MSEQNFRIVKVVETRITTYSMTCDPSITNDQACALVEAKHAGNPEIIEDPNLRKVEFELKKVDERPDFKTRVEYQLMNDRPKPKQQTRGR